ncbi:hypothetical protein DPMN_151701, partial [Dreissena polymorpha]
LEKVDENYLDVFELNCGNQILKAFANSLDPDETPQNVASHQDPNYPLEIMGTSRTRSALRVGFRVLKQLLGSNGGMIAGSIIVGKPET